MPLTQQDRVKGARIRGRQEREKALTAYYTNPAYCLHCGKMIKVKEGQKPSLVKKRKFCNRSHASTYNNAKYPKRQAVKEGPCLRCGRAVLYRKQKKGFYLRRSYCEDCVRIVRVEKAGKRVLKHMTKRELRENRRTLEHFRASIHSHARRVYYRSGKPRQCIKCGYQLHFHVSHIQEIEDFSDDALIGDINHIDNLVAFCPTHHWEFDNGHLAL